jgi:ATP synthase F1 delta subunit
MLNAQLIAKSYAKAIFNVAEKCSKVSAIYDELLAIQTIVDSTPQFGRLLYNKFAPVKELLVFYNTYVHESRYSSITNNFLVVLKNNRRLFLLKLINKYLYDFLLKSEHTTLVLVTLPGPVSTKADKEIQEKVSHLFESKVLIKTRVDKKIMGGLVVEYDYNVLDLSLSARVSKFKSTFLKDDL